LTYAHPLVVPSTSAAMKAPRNAFGLHIAPARTL
jgi:hypothetical protein